MRRILSGTVAALTLIAGAMFMAGPAYADTVTIEYEVTTSDLSVNTWPVASGDCDTDQRWWATGSKFYIEEELRVSVTGAYTFVDQKTGGFVSDAALIVLTGSLDPDDVSNCIMSIDDYGTVMLEAGVTYTLALSSFQKDSSGQFSYAASGAGTITVGKPADSTLLFDSVTTDTDTDVVLAASPVASVLGVDLSGSVTFAVDGVPVGSAPVDSSTGEASINIGRLPVGVYALTADYSGVPNKTNPASATATLSVGQTITTTTLGVAPVTLTAGEDVTYTATVSGINPTGMVEFYDGTHLLGSAPIVGGVATLTMAPAAGTYGVTARYLGDASYVASSSAAVTVKVAAKPDPKPKPEPKPDPKPEPVPEAKPAPAQRGTELAHTGGAQEAWWLAGGLLLTVGASLLMVRRKAHQ